MKPFTTALPSPNDNDTYNPLFNVGDLRQRRIMTGQRGAWIFDCAWEKQSDLWMLHIIGGSHDGGVTGIRQILTSLVSKKDDIQANLIHWTEETVWKDGPYYYSPRVPAGTKQTASYRLRTVRLAPEQLKKKYKTKGKKASGGFVIVSKAFHLGDNSWYEGWALPRSCLVGNTDPDFLLLLPKAASRAERMTEFYYQLIKRLPLPFLVPDWALPLWEWMQECHPRMITRIESFGHFDAYLCHFNQEKVIEYCSQQIFYGHLLVPGYEDANRSYREQLERERAA